MMGAPVTPGWVGTASIFSGPPFLARALEMSCWFSARMLMLNARAAWMARSVSDSRTSANSASGGSSDSELNELTVMP
jgi:hypothetical protein